MHLQLDPLLVVQHGLVTRFQAWEAGLSKRQIDGLLARGLLVAVHRGVFRDPAAPVTLEQRALAATLASGPGAVASHRLAVAVWGMRNFQCHLSEVTAPGLRRIAGVHAHRSVRPPDQTTLRGVPVTTPARTMIDVASLVSTGVVTTWLQQWLSSNLLTLDDLDRQMTAVRGHPGVPAVRAALTASTLLHAVADSGSEADLGSLLLKHGLPPLLLHHVVTVASGAVYELDWSYPDRRAAFEMDGYGVHMRSLAAFEHDRFRRNELEIEGWTILNFTRRQVQRRSKVVVEQVRRLLDARPAA